MTIPEIQSIIQDKVVGRIIPRHDDTGHHYEFTSTGQIVDSITTKLIIEKAHLRLWYAKKALEFMEPLWQAVTPANREDLFKQASFAGTRERDKAGDIGTAVHKVVEEYLKQWIANNEKPNDIRLLIDVNADYRVFAGARSAEKLFRDFNIIPVATELLVGDDKLGIAGTLDFLALYEDKLVIGDWKTSNAISEDYAIQISAYQHCFEYMTGLKTSGCILAHLNKNYDDCTLYTIPNTRAAFKRYKDVASIYDWIHNEKEKLIKVKRKIKYDPKDTGNIVTIFTATITNTEVGGTERPVEAGGTTVLS